MNKKILLSVFAVAGLLFTSCSDFLDAENKSAGSDSDTYFSTAQGMISLKANAYGNLKTLASQTDIYEWGTDLYIATRGGDPGELHRYSLTPETKSVTSFYQDCYTLINSANAVVYYAGNDEKSKDEGIFLRAYGYYLLTQHFGAVPYIAEYVNNASTDYPKTPLADIYTNMITDLEGVISNNKLDATSHIGYASIQAAEALLAKDYLAAGWDLNTTLTSAEKGTYSVSSTDYFLKAAQTAEKAINGVQLSMSFENKWSPFNEGNSEEIFSVQYDRASFPGDVSKGGHGLQNDFGSYYGESDKTGYKQCSSGKAPSEKSLYLFTKGDERYDATYMTTIYNWDGTQTGTGEKTGYYGYYNGNKNTLPIGLRYFPYYVSQAEAEAEFAASINRYKKGDNINQANAYILGNSCTKYTFKADGTYTKTQIPYQTLIGEVYGTVPVKKWDDAYTILEAQNRSNDYRDIVLLHVSDMYLVAAEAYLMAGNQASALSKLNAVRSRAKASALASFNAYVPEYTTPSSFGEITPIDVILDERARELYAENERWMDLRRTKQLVRYNVAFNDYITTAADMGNSKGELKWYRPIPNTAIMSNTSLSQDDQNPGY